MSLLLQVFHDLIRFETELWNALDARLRAEGLVPLNRFEPMQIIAQRDGCRVEDIAQALAITVGGTSKLVDRLEASGYCRRRANTQDRRSSLLELTEAGQQMLVRATIVVERELHCRLGAILSPASLDQLHALLTQLRDAGHNLEQKEKL